jgi:glycosyltransferase involved in cell wall biosynthesis
MKIAFLLTQSLDSPSGLGRFGPLARQMAAAGHAVELFALHPDFARLQPRAFLEGGVQVRYVSQMHVQKSGARKTYFGPGRLLSVVLAATLRLALAASRSPADILQVCKPHPMNTLAARLARRGRPIFYDCDDYEAQTNRFAGRWQQRIVSYFEDSVLQDAAGLTVNTRFLEQRFIALGFPAHKIVYVPNGVEAQRFAGPFDPLETRQRLGLPPAAPLVVYAGTLGLLSHPLDLLFEAFPLVLQRLPQARLLVVGGGEDYDTLQALAVRLGIAAHTHFTGRVPASEVASYLAAADVSVDPVKEDEIARARSPLKVFESLAVGVPVVTSPVGDRQAILGGGRGGLLVPPGSSQALADGLVAILSDPALRQRLRAEALHDRQQWYWESLTGRFAEVYRLAAPQP